MPIDAQNVLAHEWIGLTVTIRDSTDPSLRGVSGIVRDETRNTFVIDAAGRLLSVLKKDSVFLAKLPTDHTVTVQGGLLRHRPEDRVKKGLAKW